MTAKAAGAGRDSQEFDSTAEVALRQELASMIHSQLRTRALMALSAAKETGASTLVRSRLRQMLAAIDEAQDEALGHPGTSDLGDLLWKLGRQFAGEPEFVIEHCPTLLLSPLDHDIAVDVLLNLVTNAERAGATHVIVNALRNGEQQEELVLGVRDNGSGLTFDPWDLDRPGGRRGSSHILLMRLVRLGGTLRRLPTDAGTSIEARWTLSNT